MEVGVWALVGGRLDSADIKSQYSIVYTRLKLGYTELGNDSYIKDSILRSKKFNRWKM